MCRAPDPVYDQNRILIPDFKQYFLCSGSLQTGSKTLRSKIGIKTLLNKAVDWLGR